MNCESISSWTVARLLDIVGTGISGGLLGNGNRDNRYRGRFIRRFVDETVEDCYC